MSKTAAGLIAFAKSKIGTPYVYGAKGTVMSLTKIQALRKVYGSNCVWKSDDKKAGKVCVDCSGLISWYTGIVRGSGQYRSTAVEVIPISKRSDAHIGWAVWMNGHIDFNPHFRKGSDLTDDAFATQNFPSFGMYASHGNAFVFSNSSSNVTALKLPTFKRTLSAVLRKIFALHAASASP